MKLSDKRRPDKRQQISRPTFESLAIPLSVYTMYNKQGRNQIHERHSRIVMQVTHSLLLAFSQQQHRSYSRNGMGDNLMPEVQPQGSYTSETCRSNQLELGKE